MGWIPEDWDFRRMDDICKKVTDGTHDTPIKLTEGIPLITTRNMQNGQLTFETDYLISEEDYRCFIRPYENKKRLDALKSPE